MTIFFYSYEACFKGEIVLPGTVANHPSNRRIAQATKKTFFPFTYLPILLFLVLLFFSTFCKTYTTKKDGNIVVDPSPYTINVLIA